MTEAEIYEFINVHQGALISVLQWWASVSFALVALAHFSRKSLNLLLVSIVLSLYVAFSLFAFAVFSDQVNRIELLVGDLAAIGETTPDVSGIVRYMIQRSSEFDSSIAQGRLPMWIACVGTFFAAITYVLYVYRAGRISQAK